MTRINRRIIVAIAATALLAVVLTPAMSLADQAYHSERLSWNLTEEGAAAGHPELRAGHDTNTHANGPVNAAIEIYMINGAMADHTYQARVVGFLACSDEVPLAVVPTTTIDTNKHGNGHAKWKFAPEDLAPFSGLTLGARWELVDEGGVVAYETECTVVTLD